MEKREKTTISLTRNVHKQLSLLKIETNAKDMDEVIKFLIERLNQKPN